jgi:hypothetical protein
VKSLNARDKRAVIVMIASAVVIFGYFWVLEPVLKDYRQLKQQHAGLEKKLDHLFSISDAGEQSQQRAVAEMVPVFEMPDKAQAQCILFRDKVTEQLQRCGLKASSIASPKKKGSRDGYTVYTIECKGQCSVDSMKKLMSELKKNPYYVAVEKMVLKVGEKKRDQVNYTLVISTYAKG